MPYFPAGGGVGSWAPSGRSWRPRAVTATYRQPVRTSRGRFGQSLSDILGTVSNVAGDLSLGTGSGGSVPMSYYAPPPPPPARSTSTGLSTTTLFGVAAIGLGVLYFATRKK